MFTGIIEEVGEIRAVRKGQVSCTFTIRGNVIFDDLKIGDSVAVNGVCLTATTISGNEFTADVMAETLRRTNLGSFATGTRVNLERAMAADGRFGGHIVSGHIDGTGTITKKRREENAVWVTVKTTPEITHYIVEKGSIAIDGISLTVAEVGDDYFKVSIIPHTGEETTLLSKNEGAVVNLENDEIAKYVEKLTGAYSGKKGNTGKSGGVTMSSLLENGFL
ncbi:MAG: riboflavin synthase [Clostridia bacterium]|nr:riboflavin synthase [Clostridia bacterium]